MSETNPVRRVVATGNASTTVFPFDFFIEKASDLVVSLVDATTLVETVLSSSEYSATGIGDEGGGYVTYPLTGSPIAVGTNLVIKRVVPYTQELKIRNQDGFLPENIERAMDRLVWMIQQIGDFAIDDASLSQFAMWLTQAQTAASDAADSAAVVNAGNVPTRRYIDALNYVSSNDTLDVITALQSAANDSDGRELVIPVPRGSSTRSYKMLSRATAHIDLPLRGKLIVEPGVTIDASGIGLATVSQQTFFSSTGTVGAQKLLQIDAAKDDLTIQLQSGLASGLARFNRLKLASTALFATAGGKKGEGVMIKDITGDVITLMSPLQDDYATGDGAYVQLITPSQLSVEWGGLLIGPGRPVSAPGDIGLELQWPCGVTVDGYKARSCDYHALRLQNHIDVTVQNSGADFDPKGSNTNVQYGLAYLEVGEGLRVINWVQHAGKHGPVQVCPATGVARGTIIEKSRIYGTWHAAIPTHDEAEDLTLLGNHILGCANGVDQRVRRLTLIGNRILQTQTIDPAAGHGVLMGNTPEKLIARNNEFSGGIYGYRLPTGATGTPLASSSGPTEISIMGDVFEGMTQRAISLTWEGADPRTGIYVQDCITRDIAGVSVYLEGNFQQGAITNNRFGKASSGGSAVQMATSGVSGLAPDLIFVEDNLRTGYASTAVITNSCVQQRNRSYDAPQPELMVIEQKYSNKTSATPSTTKKSLEAVVIPAGFLGVNGAIVVEFIGTCASSANAKTWFVELEDGTVVGTYTIQQTATTMIRHTIRIQNEGVANAQIMQALNQLSYNTNTSAPNTMAVNTALPITVRLSCQCADAADSMTLKSYTVKVENPV